MSSVNQLLRTGYKINDPQLQDVARDLAEEGLGELSEERFIECTSRDDDDYEIAEAEGCENQVRISTAHQEEGYVKCECGRLIDLNKKNAYSDTSFVPDQKEIRDYIRETISSELDLTEGRVGSLTYFSHRFEDNVVDFDIERVRNSEYIDTTIRVHFCFNNLKDKSVDTIKLYGRQSMFVLIGDGVLSKSQFRENDIPFLTFGDFYNTESDIVEKNIWKQFKRAMEIDQLTDIDRRAMIAKNLYENSRGDSTTHDDVIDEDDFEHMTNCLLNYCFKTSTIFGSTDSGMPVPDGVLCLQTNNNPRAYLWDAKYSDPDNEPHELSSSDQQNMTKYPVSMRDLSNVGDDSGTFNQFSGFLLISPKVKENHVEGLAEKISRRYEQRGDTGGLPVIHLKINALIQLYDLLRKNASGAQKQMNWVRFEFDKLLRRTEDHINTPEFPDAPDELTVIDVSADEVCRVFEDNLDEDDIPFDELNYESIRDRIDRMSF